MTRLPRHYAAARGSYAGEVLNATRDFGAAFSNFRLWSAWAWNDILARYRGSVLGPFWITLTSAAFAIGVGLVYSDIMKVPPTLYVRWIATGVVIWNFILVSLTEGCETFIAPGALIRQTSIPLPVFFLRVILRNIIVLLHQAVVIVGVAVYYKYILSINLPVFLIGFVVVVLNVSWMALLVGVVAARFRDLQQVVVTVLQLAFFLSPIIWMPKETSVTRPFLELNPIYHMLDVTRNPLIGEPAHMKSFVFLLVMAVCGWVVAFAVFATTRRRIVHYL